MDVEKIKLSNWIKIWITKMTLKRNDSLKKVKVLPINIGNKYSGLRCTADCGRIVNEHLKIVDKVAYWQMWQFY